VEGVDASFGSIYTHHLHLPLLNLHVNLKWLTSKCLHFDVIAAKAKAKARFNFRILIII
jgi:hypothetical protein